MHSDIQYNSDMMCGKLHSVSLITSDTTDGCSTVHDTQKCECDDARPVTASHCTEQCTVCCIPAYTHTAFTHTTRSIHYKHTAYYHSAYLWERFAFWYIIMYAYVGVWMWVVYVGYNILFCCLLKVRYTEVSPYFYVLQGHLYTVVLGVGQFVANISVSVLKI